MTESTSILINKPRQELCLYLLKLSTWENLWAEIADMQFLF